MVFDRASKADYDAWEDLGNPGWGWDGLYKYFKKVKCIPSSSYYPYCDSGSLRTTRARRLARRLKKAPQSMVTHGMQAHMDLKLSPGQSGLLYHPSSGRLLVSFYVANFAVMNFLNKCFNI